MIRFRPRPLGRILILGCLSGVIFLGGDISSAEARGRGLSGTGCGGCHGETVNSNWVPLPSSVPLGQTTTLEFILEDPDAQVGGIFIEVADPSLFSVSSDSRLAVVSTGITHVSPKNYQAGRVVFPVTWRVPSTPGATRFEVEALGANGNGRNSGDESNASYFDVVYGCEPQTYYRDFDGDGYGRESLTLIHCQGGAPEGYGELGTDCDDNNPDFNPGAVEICNQRDDDCDGEIDEEAIPAELYPDADGDGYYSTEERLSGDVEIGCLPLKGYAALPGDCSPDNPDVNPGKEEVCDMYLDEDCDGRVDERVRPICGVGWCRRESRTCNIADCTPGEPLEEECNFLDDDCDDLIDEGDLCDPGYECLAGECRIALREPSSAGPGSNGSGASGSGTNPDAAGCAINSCGTQGSSRGWIFTLVLSVFAIGLVRRRGLLRR